MEHRGEKYILTKAAAAFLALSFLFLTMCNPNGCSARGVITDKDGKPIPGAFVLAKWERIGGMMDSGRYCVRINSDITDERGRYFIPPWIELSPLELFPWAFNPTIYIYANGYQWSGETDVGDQTLRRFTGSKKDLFRMYIDIYDRTRCGAKGQEKIAELLLSIYHDALKVAETPEELKNAEEILEEAARTAYHAKFGLFEAINYKEMNESVESYIKAHKNER